MARGWSGYLVTLLSGMGIELPSWLTTFPLNEIFDLNFFAGISVILVSVALFAGTESSSKANSVCRSLR